VFAALILAVLAAPAAEVPPEAARALALAQKIQAHHEGVRDLKARFVQTYTSGLLGREVVERGTVAIKRPDRMLWKYEQPEAKTFVADGKTSYFYVPADRQVIVREATGERGVALQLLSGRSDLLGQFEIFAVDQAPDRVRLVPRANDPETREVVVTADAGGRILRLDITDTQGNRSSFRFEDLQENVGLADKLFEFKIPRGVEVVAG
jgi:outer membrane lipoprotein carrier protein